MRLRTLLVGAAVAPVAFASMASAQITIPTTLTPTAIGTSTLAGQATEILALVVFTVAIALMATVAGLLRRAVGGKRLIVKG